MSDRHDLWQRAVAFAARAHRHQLRKDGETPYAAHPFRVAMTVRHIFQIDDDIILAAALLHDVIEDTEHDFDDVLAAFGPDVAEIVAAMTKDMRLIEPEREESYDEQLRNARWEARLVKLADVYDNLSDAAATRPGDVPKLVEKANRALAMACGDARLKSPAIEIQALIARAIA